jgi:hypothetical protein
MVNNQSRRSLNHKARVPNPEVEEEATQDATVRLPDKA